MFTKVDEGAIYCGINIVYDLKMTRTAQMILEQNMQRNMAKNQTFLRVIDISKKITTMRGFEDVVSDD